MRSKRTKLLINGKLPMQQPEMKTLILRKQSLYLLSVINLLNTKAVKTVAMILPTAPLVQMKLIVCLDTSTLIARKA